MKGNEAVAEAAIQAGCRYFFGYLITPQNEIPEYMARRLPEVGGCFLQVESDLSDKHGLRRRASGRAGDDVVLQPGDQPQAGGHLVHSRGGASCVIVNMVWGGPWPGRDPAGAARLFRPRRAAATAITARGACASIGPGSGGHGDGGFDIADQYRIPVLLLGDGMIGQG